MIYTMNPIALVVFILIIMGGIVNIGIEVFQDKKRSPAGICFFLSVFVLGLADLFFVVHGDVNSSVSAWIASHGAQGFWKFAVGCVCGHLFFPVQRIDPNGVVDLSRAAKAMRL